MLNNLLTCHTFYRKKERIDEQEISLLSSILFVKHMTTFSGLRKNIIIIKNTPTTIQ